MAIAETTDSERDRTEDFLALFSHLRKIKGDYSAEGTVCIERSISGFLSFYERHKTQIDKRCINKIIFSDLPSLCFEQHVENGKILAKILQSIHNLPSISMPHLVLFLSILCLTHRTLSMDTIKKRNEMKKSSFSSLTYFLHYAFQQRLTLRGMRLTEMITMTNPLLFSKFMFFSNSRCLLALLQFGLRFEFSKECDMAMHPIFLCAAELLNWFIEAEHVWNNENPRTRRLQKYSIEKLSVFCRNFKMLLLSTSNPYMITSHMVETLMKYSEASDFEQLKPYLEYFFPDLDFRSCKPPSLQYVCRYVIRTRLHENWCLPYGVWKLPLPRTNVCYLNFTVDEKGNKIFQ